MSAVRRSPFARLVDGIGTRRRGLPRATHDYTVDRGLRIPMRDGVELVADLYQPIGNSRGLILVRSAYGRGFLLANEYARPYAERGFAVLMQSTRGTFGSGGTKVPFHGEIDDGADTVEWLRHQSWFPGKFGMHGASYLGFNAWAVMMSAPAELATAVLPFAPHNLGRILHESGATTIQTALQFSDSFSRQESDSVVTQVRRATAAQRRHAPVFATLPLLGAEVDLLEGRAPWYREWLSHTDPDDQYWDDGDFDAALQRADIPLLIEAGWQDVFLDGNIVEYETLRSRGIPVALTIGPWTHGDIGGSSSSTLTNEALAWFEEHLAGEPGTRSDKPVRIYVTGGDEWRSLPSWPPATADRTLRLGSAGTLADAGSTGSTSFTYDPASPTPSVGGASQAKDAGVRDNGALEERDDVLTFTGETLTADVEVIGIPRVRLFHDTDNPHADLFIRLCDVDPDGRSHNVTERYARLDPAAASGELEFALRPLAHRFLAGHRIRLQISGGAFPRYLRNLGTDAAQGEGTELVPSNRTVWHDPARQSSLTIPVTELPA